jgi:hypothetical protein
MKKISILFSLLVLATNTYAALPKDIAQLQGRAGVLVTTQNGKVVANESNIHCTVEESQYGEGSVIIEASTYFTPTAHLIGASREVSGSIVQYTTASTGKRPGGSVCGDIAPLTSYKQTVTVTPSSLTIREKFACAFFDRNEVVQTCSLK